VFEGATAGIRRVGDNRRTAHRRDQDCICRPPLLQSTKLERFIRPVPHLQPEGVCIFLCQHFHFALQ